MNTHIKSPAASIPLELAEANSAFQARYRDSSHTSGDWNDVLALQLNHRSIRAYLPDALPEGTVEKLVAAAQSAATSSNLQLWSVIAVENGETRARLSELANGQKHIAQAPLLLVWLADLSRAERQADVQGQTKHALEYLDLFVVATTDAAIAAQNAVLAAESLGLGTVYIGALRNKITEVAAILKLPKHVYPVFGLVIGRPDPSVASDIKPRLPQSVVLHREVYAVENEVDAIADYDERSKAFQAEQGLPLINWSRQLVERIGTPAGLHGRERLKDALASFGFSLK